MDWSQLKGISSDKIENPPTKFPPEMARKHHISTESRNQYCPNVPRIRTLRSRRRKTSSPKTIIRNMEPTMIPESEGSDDSAIPAAHAC